MTTDEMGAHPSSQGPAKCIVDGCETGADELVNVRSREPELERGVWMCLEHAHNWNRGPSKT